MKMLNHKPISMPKVQILMGVRNGAAHLDAQLTSFTAQSLRSWQLTISNDASTDVSHQILHHFARQNPKQTTLIKGPNTGFSDNYMSLIRALPAHPTHIAFADQDDIWLPQKLTRAINQLQQFGDTPALYCGRQIEWFPATNTARTSPKRTRPLGLKNALIENVASGNTIVLNPAAARLARTAAQRTGPVFAHDWWLYLLLTATGGQVHFDNGPPLIRYRQHASNQIGAGRNLRAQIDRKMGVIRGQFRTRIEGNLAALRAIDDLLTDEARATCDTFRMARNTSLFTRMTRLHDLALYRQNRLHTLGFWGAASLGRV